MTLGARAGWALAVGLVIALVAVAAGAGRWLGDGRAGALVFDVSAPFPLAGMAVNIGTVTGGKYTVAAQNVPVPSVSKW